MSDRPNVSDPRIRLGRRIASYHATSISRLLPVGTLVAGSGSTVMAAWGWMPAALARWLLVLGLSGICLAVLLFRRRRITRRINLHQHGLHWIEGRRYTVVFWDQIREVYQSPIFNRARILLGWTREPTHWACRIVCRDGRMFRIAGYEGLSGLGERIQSEVTKRLLPLVLDSYQCGYVIRFGRRIAVSDEGIHVGFKCLSWHEIADVTIDESDAVRIARAGVSIHWLRIPISQLANRQVFSHLLDSIRNAAARVDDSFGLDDSPSDPDQQFLAFDRRSRLIDDDLMDRQEVSADDLIRTPGHRPRRPR